MLSQCLEWTKQMIDKKQELVVDIRMGDFKFFFDSKKISHVKHKSPSQLRRDYERQTEFKEKQFVQAKYKVDASEKKDEVDNIFVKQETFQNDYLQGVS